MQFLNFAYINVLLLFLVIIWTLQDNKIEHPKTLATNTLITMSVLTDDESQLNLL